MLMPNVFLTGLITMLPFLAYVTAALPPSCGVCGQGNTQCGEGGVTVDLISTNTFKDKDNVQKTVWTYRDLESPGNIKVTKIHKIGTAYTAINVEKPSVNPIMLLDVGFRRPASERLLITGNCVKVYKDKVIETVQLRSNSDEE